MILVDKDIQEYVNSHKLITKNFNKDNLGCVSYDLTIDKVVGLESDENSASVYQYDLAPGEAIFVKTKEMLDIPDNILGRIAQKNSRMRMGLYVDGPHYHPGHLTYAYLRVQNISSNMITIKSGDKIAQIMFEQLSGTPNRTYGADNAAFANEVEFKGLSSYKEEYKKSIKKIEKIKQNIDDKENQIYANVLTLMGIIAAVFALITINFEAFNKVQIDIKFILTMNLSLVFAISVFFGLLYIITNRQKSKGFLIVYIILLLLILVATLLIYYVL